MGERSVYIPTDYIEKEVKSPIIFLAGPIQGTYDWQTTASGIIHTKRPDIIIASPRREYLPGDFDYTEQVNWETAHLKRAGEQGAILFWLAKEMDHDCNRAYAQTTRAELFEWKVRHERDGSKLVIGIEDGFSGAKYIRTRFSQDCRDVFILNDLELTCTVAIELTK